MNPMSQAATWDLVSEGYDAVTRPMLTPFSERALELVPLAGARRVLDLGCGSGTTTLLMADKAKSIAALDFSPKMIDRLQQALKKRDVTTVTAHVGDGQCMPFADAYFDIVVSMFGLMFFPDKQRAFAELARVLAPGGSAVIGSWASLEKSTLTQAVIGALSGGKPQGVPPSAASGPRPVMLDTEQQLRDAIAHSPLRLVIFEECVASYSYPSATAFWNDTERGTAPVAMMKEAKGASWPEIRRDAIAYLEESMTFPCQLGTTANLAVLIKD